MKLVAHQFNFPFPYVIDDSQETARFYNAICTPDFFGRDAVKLQLKFWNLTKTARGIAGIIVIHLAGQV